MITINNLRCSMGQKKNGVQFGGDMLLNLFNKSFYNINTFEINSFEDYTNTYNQLKNINNFNINLGGDHSIGSITIQSQLNKYKDDLLVIWIDAHADVNTFETSTSQNIHGMPVAPLLGLMSHWWKSEDEHYNLKPENLLYIGIRDLDEPEIETIKKLNINHFSNYSLLVNKWIQNHSASKIHISLDIDSIDPLYTPSTGTRSNNGLLVDDVTNIIKVCKDKLIGIDIVEFNPLIGTSDDVSTTLNTCQEIINSLI